jgi:hypothetical protein
MSGNTNAIDAEIVKAANSTRHVAVYLALAGIVGVCVGDWSGLLVVLLGASVLGGAWLIRRFYSRLAAVVLLLGSMAVLGVRLADPDGIPITGFAVMSIWVATGALAVYATIRYHRAINHSRTGGMRRTNRAG